MEQRDVLKIREDMMKEQESLPDFDGIGFSADAKEYRLEEIFAKAEKRIKEEGYDEIVKEYNDPVNEPQHYKGAGIEAIDVIHAFTPDPYSAYMGNVIKYVLRHMEKGNEKQDLEKARWYLDRMIAEWNA